MKSFVIFLLFSFFQSILSNEILKNKVNDLLNNKELILNLYKEHKNGLNTLKDLLNEIQEDIENKKEIQYNNRHILTILTDDQGWDDIGYNDPTFVSPTIDFIASQGIKFDSFYTHSTCTPTRAALITGLYASKTGLPDLPIIPGESRQLPLHLKTTGNIVKELYPNTSNYFIGKWHLGNKHLNQTALYRGYDYFFGILGGAVDHYNRTIGQRCGSADNYYSAVFANNCKFWNGYDLQENGKPYYDIETFSGDLFTNKAIDIIKQHNPETSSMLLHFHLTTPHTPLQAPEELTPFCDNVSPGSNEAYQTYYRQIICSMILSVDINILQLILTLVSKDMLASTLILYHSDNGGYLAAGSLNGPYYGQKGTLYEGGIRVPAFIYGTKVLKKIHRKDLIHVVDVLPTLLGYLGTTDEVISTYNFDGINHWNHLVNDEPLQRYDINIDISSGYMGYSSSYLRIIQNETWKYIYNPSVITFLFLRRSPFEEYQFEGEFLFNLSEDPSETNNLIPLLYQNNDNSNKKINKDRVQRIFQLLKQEVIRNRENSYPTLLTGMPPVYDYPPSPLGCWLPLDSPYYHTYNCNIHTVFELPKLPPGAKFLPTFEGLPNITSYITVESNLEG